MARITFVRPIAGYSGYWVTSDGRVASTITHNGNSGRWLKPSIHHHGYLYVALYLGHRRRYLRICRLVLETFVGSCPVGMEACHGPDANPANNRLENLRWGTRSSNAQDTVARGTCILLARYARPRVKGSRNGAAKLTEQQARQLIYTWRTGLFTQVELARQYGISSSRVSDIVNRRAWGHLWDK